MRVKSKTKRKGRRGIPVGLAVAAGLAALGFGLAVVRLAVPGGSGPAESAGLAVGASAPTLALPATTGGTLSLDRLRGTKIIVYFYEGAG